MFKTRSSSDPPGPEGAEIPRWLYEMSRNTFRAFCRLSQKYGDIVRMPFRPGRSIYLLSHPDYIQQVLQKRHRKYQKAVTYDYLKPIIGTGLITSEGEFWLRQRRLVAPMFHRDRVHSYADSMVDATERLLADWERRASRGASIDISEEMAQLTLTIAGEILFNRDIGAESDRIGEALMLLFRDINYRIISPVVVPRSVPTPHNRRVERAIEELEEIVYDLIEERRGRADEYDDLLSMLMLAEDEETGERMTDEQVRDEVMSFILAGHETTSNALAWSFYLQSQYPEVRRRVEREADDVIGDGRPDFETVTALEYTDRVLDETLRLYPPAWTIEREPVEDDEIGGYRVPTGSIVMAAPYFVHHNPDVWHNPEGFDPDRFADDADGPDHPYAHFPFGGGPRMCVGADFAAMESKIIMSMVARRFRLDLVPNQSVEPEGTVTLYPKHGIEMDLERRETTA